MPMWLIKMTAHPGLLAWMRAHASSMEVRDNVSSSTARIMLSMASTCASVLLHTGRRSQPARAAFTAPAPTPQRSATAFISRSSEMAQPW